MWKTAYNDSAAGRRRRAVSASPHGARQATPFSSARRVATAQIPTQTHSLSTAMLAVALAALALVSAATAGPVAPVEVCANGVFMDCASATSFAYCDNGALLFSGVFVFVFALRVLAKSRGCFSRPSLVKLGGSLFLNLAQSSAFLPLFVFFAHQV